MNQDKNEAAQEFMEEVVGDLGYKPKGERNQRSRSSVDLKFGPKHLISVCIGILLLIAIISFLMTDRTGGYTEDLASIKAGLNRLEERLARLDGLEDRIVRLEKKEKKLRQTVKNLAELSLKSYSKNASSQVKTHTHTVRAGDSLYSIAKRYGTTTNKLCRLNKIKPEKPLQLGQKLLVGR